MNAKTRNLIFLTVLVHFVLLTGCASWEGKFSGTKEANVGIFADQTIATLTDPDLGLPVGKSVYVREYVDPSEPEEQEFTKLEKELERRLLTLVKYSIALVDIAETSKTDKERVEKYADFLAALQKKAEERHEQNAGHYDELIEKIRSAEKFHDALQMAQPLINASGRAYQILLDELDQSLKILEAKLDQKIDKRFDTVIKYQKALEEEKYAILIALGQLYATYKGEPEAFQKLRDSGVIRRKALLPKGTPTEDEMSQIAEHLVKRLEITHKIWREIEPDWELYRATHRELDELYTLIKTGINETRAIVIIWARAHQKMAAGKTNPAEWFDIEDAPAQLFKLGTKAVF
ncbi:hypothetical protein [Kaarinaea lacus]